MATVVPSIACLGVIGRNNNPLHLTILPSYKPTGSATTAASSSPMPTSLDRSAQQGAEAAVGPIRTPLQFSLLVSSTLDVFELRARQHAGSGAGALSGDLGLLCAVDERVACYGFETNTGVRFVAVVDMRGRLLLDPSLPTAAVAVAGGEAGGAATTTKTAAAAQAAPSENAIAFPSVPPLSGIGLLSTSPSSSSSPSPSSALAAALAASKKPSVGASLASLATGLRDADLKPLFRAMHTAWVRLLQNPFFDLDDHVPPAGRGGKKITSRKFANDMTRLATAWVPGVGAFDGF